MKTNTIPKRILTIMLTLIMGMMLLPTAAFADKAMVDTASATITAPVAGATPDMSPVSGDSSKYTVGVDSWSHVTEEGWQGAEMAPGETFVNGVKYMLKLRFYDTADYRVSNLTTVTVNGQTAMDTGSGSSGGSFHFILFKLTFTATTPPIVFPDNPAYDIPNGEVNIPYTSPTAFTASGGTGDLTFSVSPAHDGLSINAENKLVFTRPAVKGTDTAYIKCTDSLGNSKSIQIIICPVAAHTHRWEVTQAKASTCTVKGNNQYFFCIKCNKYYKPNQYTETTLAAETLPLAPHTLTHHAAKAATCTAAGNIEYWSCSVCGKYFSDAAGTAETTAAAVKIATIPHTASMTWSNDTTNHWHVCTVCNTALDTAAHTYGNWTVTKEATATATGSKERICSVCGRKETEVIPKLAPSIPTAAPGTPTAAPGTPTAAPGTPTAAPGTPTAAPGTPTAAPGTPTAAPGTPTATPGTPATPSSEGTAAFVDRLYSVCLERLPDAAGKADWVNQLESFRISGSKAAYGFIFSPEFQGKNYSAEDYVEHLYAAFMGRASDAAGKADWVNQLNAGKSREEVFYGFANSVEFDGICNGYGIVSKDIETFVTRFYSVCLGRRPDAGGLADWSEQLRSKTSTGRDIAYGFIFSPEFTGKGYSNEDYVEHLYAAFMGRPSDPAGKADWVSRLNAGASREDVFNGFVGSKEFSDICASYDINRG